MPSGRGGKAVRIHTASGRSFKPPKHAPPYPNGPARVGTYTVVFDPNTSELRVLAEPALCWLAAHGRVDVGGQQF